MSVGFVSSVMVNSCLWASLIWLCLWHLCVRLDSLNVTTTMLGDFCNNFNVIYFRNLPSWTARFRSKVGKIGPKCDKSGTLLRSAFITFWLLLKTLFLEIVFRIIVRTCFLPSHLYDVWCNNARWCVPVH